MLAREATALEDPDINSFELFELAAVHAGLGETEKAAELNRRSLQLDLVAPYWKTYLQLAAPNLESKMIDGFLAEHEAEARRLRELY